MGASSDQATNLLANVGVFLSMTKPRKPTAVLSLAKYSLLALLLGGIYLFFISQPVSKRADLREFEVKKGESIATIATHLKSAGLIRSPLYFRFLAKLQDLTLQAGMFQISPASSPSQVALILTSAKGVDRKLTIPEGFRIEQIAETAGFTLSDFKLAAKGFEGQLFPDTYFIKAETTPAELVKIMHDNFLAKAGSVSPSDLILASLVERETRGDAEKPVVAGILKKRLAAGWPLELDATIQYFLGKSGNWWPDTTLLDRQLKSPYNTYLNKGLPPAPIGNPGLASIRGVQSSMDSPYWFYLHDRQGTIHYGATSAEHSANIAKYITH